MKCSQCGAELPANATQCPACQAATAQDLPPLIQPSKKIFVLAAGLIILFIIAISYPSFNHERVEARSLICQENLMRIELAKLQWQLDHDQEDGAVVTWDDLSTYWDATAVGGDMATTQALQAVGRPSCPAGGEYQLNPIGVDVTCSFEPPKWAPPHALPQK